MNSAIQRLREFRALSPAVRGTTTSTPQPQAAPWDDPVVAAARREAERVGVWNPPATVQPSHAYRWVDVPEPKRLPGAVGDLVSLRVGWTPDGWAAELERKASCCEAMHPDLAQRYRAAAGLLTSQVTEGA
jgi:hypothetical protein